MKKFLFPMLAVLAALGAQARTLTPDEALSRLQTDPVAAKASAARGIAATQPHLAFTQTTETGQPAVYVFDNQASNQVLFVSADDVVAPLLGYADSTPAGTEMPPQLNGGLNSMPLRLPMPSSTASARAASRLRAQFSHPPLTARPSPRW